MIHRSHALPVTRQARELGISRGSVYYLPRLTSAADLAIMRRIDALHMDYPFAGSRMLRDLLAAEGIKVGRLHVSTLMKRMTIEAIYRRPNTSKSAPGHKIYPYLLRKLAVTRPNQVWATDITYIPMARGFVYLIAIVDWFSRRVLSWRLSITLETDFCIEALEEALRRVGAPEIFNTDQGSQFTSVAFTGLLLLGFHPLELLSPADFRADPDPWVRGTVVVLALANLALGVIVLLKGKIWTGLLGLFVLPILVLAAVRLSRPSAPWARWRYTTRPKKMERALRREKRWRRPIIRAKIYLQDAIAGKPSIVHAREATEDELSRTVLPAPMASGAAAGREAPISSNA